jgi:NhaP-type Na+/H+ or K+/H+ antiporter
MVVPALERINSTIIVYSILSLTVIRMLPVAFSLIGMKLRPLTILFLGWFGPRGVASILFGLLVLERHDIVGHEEIFMAVVVVVFVSVFAHGLSALPAANYYADHAKSLPNQNIPELHPITEMPIRYHHHHHNHKLREKRQ